MLSGLYIRNYALFRETRVSFLPGFNVLTGETGAGKSLLVGALGLIAGKRADSSAVFFPGVRCVVEAEFDALSDAVLTKLQAFEEFDLEGNALVIRRELASEGKSRAFVNDTPVSLQCLREVALLLFDLHSQHENQSLLIPERQMEMLDAYAGCGAAVEAFRLALANAQQQHSKIASLEKSDREARQQQDFIAFQLNELQSAQLQAAEENELEQELRFIQQAENVREALDFASSTLYEQDPSVYSQLSEVLARLEKLGDVHEKLNAHAVQLRDALAYVKDAGFELKNLLEELDAQPERLAFIEERLSTYHRLKLKFNVRDAASLIALRDDLLARVQGLDSIEAELQELRAAYEICLKELAAQGLAIEASRLAAIPLLEQEVNTLLREAGFQDACLRIELERNEAAGAFLKVDGIALRPLASGINRINLLIRTNTGLPFGQLALIASGGEISRVMLAIKAALAGKAEFPVLIFDEIDAGISGEVANKVGKLMQQLSDRFQVISITHLPQIAARGQRQFLIYKQVEEGRAYSSVRELAHEERVTEVAKMLSGDQPSQAALQNARDLIGLNAAAS